MAKIDRAQRPTSSFRTLLFRLRRSALLWIVLEASALVAVAIGLSELWSLVHPGSSASRDLLRIIKNLTGVPVLAGAYAGLVMGVERRSPAELSFKSAAAHLPIGVAIGVGLISLVYGVLWCLGLADLAAGVGLDRLGAGLSSACFAAVFEELLMRAVLFRLLDEAFGDGLALAVSAAVFGLLHGLNPGATLFSDAAIALEAGVLLALAFALTRKIWLAVGIHAGWNFAEGGIYGASVSGGPISPSLIKTTLHGPPLLTGGPFGPEGSMVSVGVCLAAAAAMALMLVLHGGWRPARFRPFLDLGV